MRAALFALACGVVLGFAWWTGLWAALHPPETTREGRAALNRVNRHSWYHALGCGLTTLVGGVVFGLAPALAAVIAAVAWAGVEAIQYWPRKPYVVMVPEHGEYHAHTSRTGTWEWLDLVFNGLGAALGWVLLIAWELLA